MARSDRFVERARAVRYALVAASAGPYMYWNAASGGWQQTIVWNTRPGTPRSPRARHVDGNGVRYRATKGRGEKHPRWRRVGPTRERWWT